MTNHKNEDFDGYFQKRVSFLRNTVAPDDIYVLAEYLLEDCVVLGNALTRYANVSTAIEAEPRIRKILLACLNYDHKLQINNFEPLKIETFDAFTD